MLDSRLHGLVISYQVDVLNATCNWPALKFFCFCKSRDKQTFCNIRPWTFQIIQAQASIKGKWARLRYRLDNFHKGMSTAVPSIGISLFLIANISQGFVFNPTVESSNFKYIFVIVLSLCSKSNTGPYWPSISLSEISIFGVNIPLACFLIKKLSARPAVLSWLSCLKLFLIILIIIYSFNF